MTSPLPVPTPRPEDPGLRAARSAFDAHQASLEAQLLSEIPAGVVPAGQLRLGIEGLSQAIADGLALGSLEVVAPELAWIEGLMLHAHAPTQWMTVVLEAYAGAVGRHLGPQGKPLVEWLAGLASRHPGHLSGG